MEDRKESLLEWFERFKREQAAKTPEQLAAEKAEHEAWLASLPVFGEGPLKPGEVRVIFYKHKPKKE